MSGKYDRNVYLAMLAEQCTRYEDMIGFLEEMVDFKKEDLNSDERNLLSIAYKNSISLRRQALRTLCAYEQKEKKKDSSSYLEYILEYKAKVEKELIEVCEKIIAKIRKSLLTRAEDAEAKVFYHKMIGDYYRYIAENITGETKSTYANKGLEGYKSASEEAKTLEIRNPIRLGLALNFSVFHFEVMEDHKKAIELAKETLDLAKKDLEKEDEDNEDLKDTFSIVNLLQENLNMWNLEEDNNDNN
jgi:14-3-3 protein epsilon